MEKEASIAFLSSLLNKHLRINTTDGRIFYGEFKCTDPDCNVVLAHTFEYRQAPPGQAEPQAPAVGAGPPASSTESTAATTAAPAAPYDIDKTARYLGLVVVPGQHIVTIAAEEKDLAPAAAVAPAT